MMYQVEDTPIKTAEDCRQICLKDKECDLFTFINFRGLPACYAMKGCNEKVKATPLKMYSYFNSLET